MCILRKKIRVLHWAEWHWKRCCERARKRAAFISNPFKLTKDLPGQKRSGNLACLQEVLDHHLEQTYSNSEREKELGECNILIDPPDPEVQFDMSELQLKEVREVSAKQGLALLQDQVALRTNYTRTVPNPYCVCGLEKREHPRSMASGWRGVDPERGKLHPLRPVPYHLPAVR